MQSPPIPENEELRLATLKAYQILDTAEESIFDALTFVAAIGSHPQECYL